jgi:hypothetical protein
LRPAQTNNLRDPFSKIAIAKLIGSVPQVIQPLLCKHKALSSNPIPSKQSKAKQNKNQENGQDELYSYEWLLTIKSLVG